MAIEKAYLLPYSPLFISKISKANYSFLEKSIQAYQAVVDDLTQAQINTIILISPHGPELQDSYLFNSAPDMKINFQDFGFILNDYVVKGDIPDFDKLKTKLEELKSTKKEEDKLNIKYLSELDLSYDSAIPLYLLNNLHNQFKFIILWPKQNLNLEEGFEFGKILNQAVDSLDKKIALITAGNLSHCLSKKSPKGYSPKGAKFDNKLIEYLQDPKTIKKNLLAMDKNLVKSAQETVLGPLSITLGALNKKNYHPKVLAYQTDFGIGYLSLDFKVKTE